MHKGTVTHGGARAVLGSVPALTAYQWSVILTALQTRQETVYAITQDTARMAQTGDRLRELVELHLTELADLRECIERHTGVRV